MSAIGSLAAFSTAALAARAAWRQVKNSDETLKQTIRSKDREQANKVAAWITVEVVFGNNGRSEKELVLRCMNSSDLPVFNFFAFPVCIPERFWQADTLPPTKKPLRISLAKLTAEVQRIAGESHSSLKEEFGGEFRGPRDSYIKFFMNSARKKESQFNLRT
ncbi:hypothetical protein [Saccharopolyspora spinosa]|uniref:hypothetical protein n=1 Tax=Saccharopolyspora spinosa TaxID=60894 RepID=UPI0011D1C4D6|nr:hypothetical protein [Saccharopolyspora spinosa]